MPVQRIRISLSQFCDLIGVDPQRLLDVEVKKIDPATKRVSTSVVLVLEPEES